MKHLEFIQAVIARLATDSFLAKGWALTVAGAIYSFALTHYNQWITLLGILSVAVFWWLDTYFLRSERLFRCLYDEARKPQTSVELFSMDVTPYRKHEYASWWRVMKSVTLLSFYATLLIAGLGVFTASIIHNTSSAHASRTISTRSSSHSAL